MILQQLPGIGGALQNASRSIIESLVQEKRLEQQERAMDLREKEFKLQKEAREEQERQRQQAIAQLLGSQAGQQAAIQSPGATQQIANAQAPAQQAIGQVTGQAAQQQFQQGGPLQRVQAGRALGFSPQTAAAVSEQEQTTRQAERQQEAIQQAVEDAPEELRPLVETGLRLQAGGMDASATNTILSEMRERLDPSDADQLDREFQRAQIEFKKARTREIRRNIQQGIQEGEVIDREALLNSFPASLSSDARAALEALPSDDLATVARERLKFQTQGSENAFNLIESLVSRTGPTGEPMFSVGQAINLTDQIARSSGVDFDTSDLPSGEMTRLRLQGAVQSVVGSGIRGGADLGSVASAVADQINTLRLPEDVGREQKVSAVVNAMKQADINNRFSEGEIRNAVESAFPDGD